MAQRALQESGNGEEIDSDPEAEEKRRLAKAVKAKPEPRVR